MGTKAEVFRWIGRGVIKTVCIKWKARSNQIGEGGTLGCRGSGDQSDSNLERGMRNGLRVRKHLSQQNEEEGNLDQTDRAEAKKETKNGKAVGHSRRREISGRLKNRT